MNFPVFVADDVDAALRRLGMRLSEDSLEPTEVKVRPGAPHRWLVRALGLLSREFVATVHAVCTRGEWTIEPIPGAPKWRRAEAQTVGGGIDPVARGGR